MKTLLYFIIFLLVLTFAEAGTLQTTVNVTTGNNTVAVTTASGSSTYSCNASASFSNTITLSYSDITCENQNYVTSNLTTAIKESLIFQKNQGDYYKLYLTCYGDQISLKNDVKNAEADRDKYADKYNKYDPLNAQYMQCQAELSTVRNSGQQCTTDLTKNKNDLNNSKNNYWVFAIIGGVVVGFFWWREKQDKHPQHPGQVSFPGRR